MIRVNISPFILSLTSLVNMTYLSEVHFTLENLLNFNLIFKTKNGFRERSECEM